MSYQIIESGIETLPLLFDMQEPKAPPDPRVKMLAQ